MKICFLPEAWQDYLFWEQNSRKQLKRINTLIKDIKTSPYKGLGKPEPLRFDLKGYWSRRIDHEHRLVYTINDNAIVIIQCRYHY